MSQVVHPPRLAPSGSSWLVVLLCAGGMALFVVCGMTLFDDDFRSLRLWWKRKPSVSATHLPVGEQLYRTNCLRCHGERGEGDGPSAATLQPPPRNFGAARFRLVTTVNRVPSDDDLLQVIRRGIPGTAMLSVAVSDSDGLALVDHVRHLVRAGMEERVRANAASNGEEYDPALVDRLTQPGETIDVPEDLPPPSTASLARGSELFARNCASCHGMTGRGDGQPALVNEDGTPTRARDLIQGIFKGGREREQVYARLVLGMPGTPMPAQAGLAPSEIGDLVNFVLSLTDQPAAQTGVLPITCLRRGLVSNR